MCLRLREITRSYCRYKIFFKNHFVMISFPDIQVEFEHTLLCSVKVMKTHFVCDGIFRDGTQKQLQITRIVRELARLPLGADQNTFWAAAPSVRPSVRTSPLGPLWPALRPLFQISFEKARKKPRLF